MNDKTGASAALDKELREAIDKLMKQNGAILRPEERIHAWCNSVFRFEREVAEFLADENYLAALLAFCKQRHLTGDDLFVLLAIASYEFSSPRSRR
jgi:hypothetical protein